MAVRINKLTNANIYIGGVNKLGSAKEIELPTLTQKMADHEALGLYGTLQYASGMEVMEGSITFNSFYADVFRALANPTQPVQLMLRGNLQTFEGGAAGLVNEVAYVCHLVGVSKELSLGTFAHHTNTDFETSWTFSSVKLEVAGVEEMVFDAAANIYRVGGVDILAAFRANIGG
jgi:P2 family phage contractile tail tube protein